MPARPAAPGVPPRYEVLSVDPAGYFAGDTELAIARGEVLSAHQRRDGAFAAFRRAADALPPDHVRILMLRDAAEGRILASSEDPPDAPAPSPGPG